MIVYGYWAVLMLHICYCLENLDKWSAMPWVSMICCMAPVALLFTINLGVVLVGILIRETKAGKACSGDFHPDEEEPEPYLWYSGKQIRH